MIRLASAHGKHRMQRTDSNAAYTGNTLPSRGFETHGGRALQVDECEAMRFVITIPIDYRYDECDAMRCDDCDAKRAT